MATFVPRDSNLGIIRERPSSLFDALENFCMATVLDKETDARFWAQTGYKPGEKLDPSNPQDKKMLPLWRNIFGKVKQEAAEGKLVTTFDHPVVAQNLADAHVADRAAAAHLDAATKSPDVATAERHVEAAATATGVAEQKAHEAATVQPPAVSPQLADEAAQHARLEPPHPDAPASAHLANAQAQKAHRPGARGLLKRETDARFWAQTHYKPGQQLDPADLQDKAMIPLWLDIFAKVKREAATDKLVLTYNHPAVVQNLADAHVADRAAAAHLDAAAAASDPGTSQQNVKAATTAAQIAAQKTREAARLQPPTVDPRIAHEASQRSDDRNVIDHETYRRFWARTGYKVGKPLDPKDPRDAQMLLIWRQLNAQVHHEHAVGHARTGRDHLAREQARGAGRRAVEVHHHHRHRRHSVRSTVAPRSLAELRAQALRQAVAGQQPFTLVVQRPDGSSDRRTFGSRAELDAEYAKLSEQHDQYKYVAAIDLTTDPRAPVHDSVGISAAEHADVPSEPSPAAQDAAVPPSQDTVVPPQDTSPRAEPPAPAAPPPSMPNGSPRAEPPSALAPPMQPPAPGEKSHVSVGKIVAIGAAVAVAGGIVYGLTRSSPQKPRTTKVVSPLPVMPMGLVR